MEHSAIEEASLLPTLLMAAMAYILFKNKNNCYYEKSKSGGERQKDRQRETERERERNYVYIF